jgi:hypothetical protein
VDLIITGRVFDGQRLIGYKAWEINSSGLVRYMYISLESVRGINKYGKLINCRIDANERLKSTLHIPIVDYPKYNKNLKLLYSKYTDSDIIAAAYNVDVRSIRILICGALVYGAISDPDSTEANAHAELYYEEIRHRSDDIEKIAKNLRSLGKSDIENNVILKIKNYLFMDYHNLETGYKRFDPSFHIAQSWQRLSGKDKDTIQKHDITLIEHEIMEMKLVDGGLDQNTAHTYAEGTYNYRRESDKYYDKIKKHNKNR